MKQALATVAWLIALSCATITSTAQSNRVFQKAIETSADLVTLPARANDGLIVTACRGCAPRRLATTEATVYQIASESVDLSTFTAFVLGQPQIALTVMHDPKTLTVSRVLATGAPSSNTARSR